MDQLAKTATEAWGILCEHGGLEPDGRDSDMVNTLRHVLGGESSSLEDALRASTTDQLVDAFFSVALPYVVMFGDILAFFRAAGATQGRAQLNLKVEKSRIDLEDFERFITEWTSVPADIAVRAIQLGQAWSFHHLSRERKEWGDPPRFQKGDPPTVGDPAVDAWLASYTYGLYLPLPDCLTPMHVDSGLVDVASIAQVAIELIRSRWSNRTDMLDEYLRCNRQYDKSDAFHPISLAQNEHDFWLGSMVFYLAKWANASRSTLVEGGEQLAKQYADVPYRKVGVRISVSQLSRLLSLPIWSKRHELYAVWIATQIVQAVDDHDCRFHTENGRLTFAFKETKLATIVSARPPVHIYSERRSDLPDGAVAAGHGRVSRVQPDYTLWRSANPDEQCGLVVEVKHYKKNARGPFQGVFVDYAAAHPQAQIVLVSHGPADVAMDKYPSIATRCHTIGSLTARATEQKKALRKLVRDYVGSPSSIGNTGQARRLVAVDISSSMGPLFDLPEFHAKSHSIMMERASHVALIDDQVREVCMPAEAEGRIARVAKGSSTDLAGPLQALVDCYDEVFVLTDEEGAKQLTKGRNVVVTRETMQDEALQVIHYKV